MKNKKILSIFLVVIVITTLFVPVFSLSAFAEDNVSNFDYIEFVLGSSLKNGTSIEIRGVDGSIVFNHNDAVNTSKKFYFLGIQPFVVTSEEDYYDVGEEYYEIVYIGPDYYYPYFDFYDLAGNRIDGMYIDEDDSEHIYISPDETVKISLQYSDTSSDVVTYVRRFTLDEVPSLEDAYAQGYNEGWQAARSHYSSMLVDKFNEGYEAGLSSGFGNDLLGDTLSAPAKALNNLVLYVSPSGYVITLWGLLSTIIGVSLFIWFMKLFAGG